MNTIFTDLPAGRLRHRITLEAPPAIAQDSFGDTSPAHADQDTSIAWTAMRTVYASYEVTGGIKTNTENQYDASEFAITLVMFTIRHQPDLTILDKWRIDWNGAKYNILNVNDFEGREREIRLICQYLSQ